jgi:hypothetical protein
VVGARHGMRMNAREDGLLGIPVAIGFADFDFHLKQLRHTQRLRTDGSSRPIAFFHPHRGRMPQRRRTRLLRLDPRELGHLGPFLGFGGNVLPKLSRRAGKHCATQIGKPRFHLGVGPNRGVAQYSPTSAVVFAANHQ